MKKISGIYQIKNLINRKIYVGSSINIQHRWDQHKSDLNKGVHKNRHLQAAWDLYKEDFFEFKILEECLIEELTKREQYWINETQCFNNTVGYNICQTAENSLGVKRSEETKRKNSLSKRGDKSATAKLTWLKVREIREKYASGKYMYEDLSKEYGINPSNIGKIVRNQTWKDESLTEEYFKKIFFVAKSCQRGEKCGHAKLTWFQVREIREKYSTGKYFQIDLAKEYCVSRFSIGSIVNNTTWIQKEGKESC
jgi:group I intron endonuclease